MIYTLLDLPSDSLEEVIHQQASINVSYTPTTLPFKAMTSVLSDSDKKTAVFLKGKLKAFFHDQNAEFSQLPISANKKDLESFIMSRISPGSQIAGLIESEPETRMSSISFEDVQKAIIEKADGM